MVQTKKLTEDDIKYICQYIGYDTIRTFFIKHPYEYKQIIDGFKIIENSDISLLSDGQISRILYRKKQYINRLCIFPQNKSLNDYVEIIKNNITKNTRQFNVNYNQSIAMSLIGTPFEKNPGLYFKLIGQPDADKQSATIKTILKNKEAFLYNKQQGITLNDTHKNATDVELQKSKDKIKELTEKIEELTKKIDEYENEPKVTDTLSTIGRIISDRITWSAMKQNGMTKNQWKNVKGFIFELSSYDLLSQISESLNCNEEQAQNLLTLFIKKTDDFFDGNTFDDDVIASLLLNNRILSKKSLSLLKEEWEKEHQQEVENAQIELSKFKSACESENESLSLIKKQVQKEHEKLEKLMLQIADKEKFAAEVEKKISEKISNAQKNAADFISQMAFVNLWNSGGVHSNDYFSCGYSYASESEEEYKDAKQMVKILSDNLESAGVMSRYSDSFASYISAAYINYFPLLIAGANADDIANAVSISLCGKMPAIVDCSAEYDTGFIKNISSCSDEIIVIHNPFSSNWIYAVIKALSIPNKFFILVEPFIEDLLIEPKSIVNYMIPLITNLLVDKEAYHDYRCGKKGKDYIDLTVTDYKPAKRKVFMSLSSNPFFSQKAAKLVFYYHLFEGNNKSIDSDIMISYAPVAYISESGKSLLEMIKNTSDEISSDCRKAIEKFFGGEDE